MERTRTTTFFRTEMRASRARFVRYDPRRKERRLRTMRENADLRGKSSSDSKDVVEEEEDAVGERAEKTVLLQYKVRRTCFFLFMQVHGRRKGVQFRSGADASFVS